MGGMIQIDFNNEVKRAEKIDLSRTSIKFFRKSVRSLLETVNYRFIVQHRKSLFKDLSTDMYFNGSTSYIMKRNVSVDTLIRHKSIVGDVDVVVDKTHKELLHSFFKENTGMFFNGNLLYGVHKSPDTLITLFRMKINQEFYNVQIDFELSEFENGIPTQWSKFSHCSSLEDQENGVKAVFHKFLIGSIIKHKTTKTINLKNKVLTTNLYKFSVAKGLRKAYKETDNIYTLLSTKDSYYETDIKKIHELMFGVPVNDKRMWSFGGIIELMKQYYTYYEIKDVFKYFVERLYGKGQQVLDNTEDRIIKRNSVLNFIEMANLFDGCVPFWVQEMENTYKETA